MSIIFIIACRWHASPILWSRRLVVKMMVLMMTTVACMTLVVSFFTLLVVALRFHSLLLLLLAVLMRSENTFSLVWIMVMNYIIHTSSGRCSIIIDFISLLLLLVMIAIIMSHLVFETSLILIYLLLLLVQLGSRTILSCRCCATTSILTSITIWSLIILILLTTSHLISILLSNILLGSWVLLRLLELTALILRRSLLLQVRCTWSRPPE